MPQEQYPNHPDHKDIQPVVELADSESIRLINHELIRLIDGVYDMDGNGGFDFGDDDMFTKSLAFVKKIAGLDSSIVERTVAVSRDMYIEGSAGMYYTFEYSELVTDKEGKVTTEHRTTWSMDPGDIDHAIVEEISTSYGGRLHFKQVANKKEAGLKPDAMDLRQGEVWPTKADILMLDDLLKEIQYQI